MSASKKKHIKKDENERGSKDFQKGYTNIHIHTIKITGEKNTSKKRCQTVRKNI